MSFLLQTSSAQKDESRVIIAQKRYYHDVLEYNRIAHINKMDARKSLKEQVNKKYSQLNKQANESLQIEEMAKKKERLYRQSILKEAYEQQIRLKQQKGKKRRAEDKEYANMYNQFIEYDNQRRVNGLLSLYQRPTYVISNRKVRTQTSQEQDPEKKQLRRHSNPHKDNHSQLFPPINKPYNGLSLSRIHPSPPSKLSQI